ncbi:MAG: multidrug effflux MFS transporter [Mesorhizobium sp.]
MDMTPPIRRASPPGIATLVLMASVGPLAMNVFLPSLPGMARDLDVEYSVVQLLVSLYLVALAVVQLVIGPASDRFGRRPVLLVCFTLFCLATAVAIFADSFEMLMACRLVQSFSAAGIVLSRAIIRDTYEVEDSASMIGYVTMGMSMTPMVAPFIGGYLDELYGWRASFWLTLACGIAALAVLSYDLKETNLSPSKSMTTQFRAYPELLASPRFWGYTLTATFTSGTFFAFLGGGPYVASEILKMTPSEYGLYFGIVSIGYMIGNFCSGRFAKTWGMNRLMLMGNVTIIVGMSIALALFWAGYYHPLSLFLPSTIVGIGNGMTLPSANAGIVSVRPHLAGSASGLGGAFNIGGGAAVAALAASLLGPDTGPFPLIWVTLTCGFAGIIATTLVIRRTAKVGALK